MLFQFTTLGIALAALLLALPAHATCPTGVGSTRDCISAYSDSENTVPCAPLPAARGSIAMCAPRNRICADLNEAQCSARGTYCRWSDNACTFEVRESSIVTAGPAISTDDHCPSMHPLVIAMLVLMFISLVGAVGVVAYVVIQRQKEADKEDAEEEARAAARAGRERNVL